MNVENIVTIFNVASVIMLLVLFSAPPEYKNVVWYIGVPIWVIQLSLLVVTSIDRIKSLL